MKSVSSHAFRAIFYSLSGFTLWVLCDTSMKLAAETDLPSYEIVGFMGLFGSAYLLAWNAPSGKIRNLLPVNVRGQAVRAVLSFGCASMNAIALKHLPLTLFYIAVFTSPMVAALLAAIFLRERLNWKEI